jgi:hypothetical protein
MALPSLGFGGGKLLVLPREALLNETFSHAAPEQELVDAAQLLLEIPVIAIAQDHRQSWTQGRLEG